MKRRVVGSSTSAIVLFLAVVSPPARAGQLIDRTVAVVGDRAITASEVEEQLAIEALDREGPVDRSPEYYRKVIERLIRLQLMQREMSLAGFVGATEQEVRRQWEVMRRAFGGDAGFRNALARYGLTETAVNEFLRRQLDFQHFVDFRFRTGLVITREQVEEYYNKEYKAHLSAAIEPLPLDRIYERLEADLIDRQVDPMLDDWINRERSQTRIKIVEAAPQPPRGEAP